MNYWWLPFHSGFTPRPQSDVHQKEPAPVPLGEEQRGAQTQVLVSSYSTYLWKLTGPRSSQATMINPSVGEMWYLQAGYLVPSMSLQTVILNFVSLWKHKMLEWFWQAILLGEVQT